MILDNTYFTSINSCEKAYILGLIIFNIKENISGKIIIEIELKTDSIDNAALSYNNVDKLIDISLKSRKYNYNSSQIMHYFYHYKCLIQSPMRRLTLLCNLFLKRG